VLVVFEGSYADYRGLQVPHWVAHYRAARFAQVIRSTPAADLARAVRLGRLRRAGYMYVTDQTGSDPYREVVPVFVELESGGPPPVACRVVGVGQLPSHPTKEGDRREQHLPDEGPSCPA
jgi:hypothetical protein